MALVSGGITTFYLTNAAALTAVGAGFDRWGPRLMFIAVTLAPALGVAGIGQVAAPWQLYAAFVCMGLGYASLSLTGIGSTLAPWFERQQGRSVAMALTGAMLVVPLLALAIARFGFGPALRGIPPTSDRLWL